MWIQNTPYINKETNRTAYTTTALTTQPLTTRDADQQLTDFSNEHGPELQSTYPPSTYTGGNRNDLQDFHPASHMMLQYAAGFRVHISCI